MKNIILLIFSLAVGCSPAATTNNKPQKSFTCYDYESCRRSCYSYDNKEDCKNIEHYK